MNLTDALIAHEGFFATQFFTISDRDKSGDFYVRILGGKPIKPNNTRCIKLGNTWIILNSGGGPTPDNPEVLAEAPSDLNRANGFVNLRVADVCACYRQWGEKGAFFLAEPPDNHGWEWRCYVRDPDGYRNKGDTPQLGNSRHYFRGRFSWSSARHCRNRFSAMDSKTALASFAPPFPSGASTPRPTSPRLPCTS